MRINNIASDEYLYQLLLEACGACGQPTRAVQVVQDMEKANIQPTTGIFASLLQVFVSNGETDEGYQVYFMFIIIFISYLFHISYLFDIFIYLFIYIKRL